MRLMEIGWRLRSCRATRCWSLSVLLIKTNRALSAHPGMCCGRSAGFFLRGLESCLSYARAGLHASSLPVQGSKGSR